MLKKRNPFRYENEVRIILLRKVAMNRSIAKVKLGAPFSLIEKVKIDPRIGLYMARLIKRTLVQYGINKKSIVRSNLYSAPVGNIKFESNIIEFDIWN